MTAAMRPSPASCSESSSAPTPRSRSTTAGPSPRYTAARRAERCSFESISLCVVLRCQAQAVAHHPRRERRRLASASPASCPGAVLWMSQAGRPGTSVRRNASPESPVSCPDPRGAAGDRIPPRRTSPRSLKYWGRFRSTLLWILRSHAARPRCVRSAKSGAASRRSSVSSRRLWGAHSSVVTDSHDHAVDATIGTVAEHSRDTVRAEESYVANSIVSSGNLRTMKAAVKRRRHGVRASRLKGSRSRGGRFAEATTVSSQTPRPWVSMSLLAAGPGIASAPSGCAFGCNPGTPH